MAIRLVFCKSDDTPWGFRLTGGADCEIPLTVIKVAESSIAESAGLQVDDIILKINEYNGEDLSHIEAHDVLMEAGNTFTMTVVRRLQMQDDESNEEVKQILEKSLQYQQTLETDHQGTFGTQQQSKGLKVHFEDETALNHVNSCSPPILQEMNPQNLLQEKKWSTFLQKPCRPIPKKNEAEKPFVEPYRVVITKQTKKSAKEIEDVPQNAAETPTYEDFEQEIENEVVVDDAVDEANDELQEQASAEYISGDEVEEVETEQEEPSDEKEEDVVEEPPSLELQLAQIQQQLQSLAQLPTSIQDTLEALTEKLAKIVGVNQTPQNSEQILQYEEHSYDEDERSYDEDDHMESIIEETVEVIDSSDEYKLDVTDMSDMSEDEANYYNPDIVRSPVHFISRDDEEKLKYEQEAERIRQQEELEKAIKQDRTEEYHQRRLEQRPTVPLAPVQRPIILPGGRKWCEPDDALPKPRKSKMTDEKICETLDNYSEIVTGHTKGINFLKYQPAPKNLDYLQRSEVFKMIHDADPPKSGIAARSGLVVSEEDYYKGNSEIRQSVRV